MLLEPWRFWNPVELLESSRFTERSRLQTLEIQTSKSYRTPQGSLAPGPKHTIRCCLVVTHWLPEADRFVLVIFFVLKNFRPKKFCFELLSPFATCDVECPTPPIGTKYSETKKIVSFSSLPQQIFQIANFVCIIAISLDESWSPKRPCLPDSHFVVVFEVAVWNGLSFALPVNIFIHLLSMCQIGPFSSIVLLFVYKNV